MDSPPRFPNIGPTSADLAQAFSTDPGAPAQLQPLLLTGRVDAALGLALPFGQTARTRLANPAAPSLPFLVGAQGHSYICGLGQMPGYGRKRGRWIMPPRV
jgi:hypothetical protein